MRSFIPFTLVLFVCLSSCKDSSQKRIFTQPPLDNPVTKLTNTLTEQEPTALLQSAASSSIPWQPWSKETFDLAKKDGKLVVTFLVDGTKNGSLDYVKHLEESPILRDHLFEYSLPVLLESQLHPEEVERAFLLSLESKRLLKLPARIVYSADGHPVTWDFHEGKNPKLRRSELATGAQMIAKIWRDDPAYVEKNSASSSKVRTEQYNNFAFSGEYPAETAKSYLTGLRQISSLYNPIEKSLDAFNTVLQPLVYRFLWEGGHAAAAPDYISSRSRTAATEIISTVNKSLSHDPVDSLFFATIAPVGGQQPQLEKTVAGSVDMAHLLIQAGSADDRSDWLQSGIDCLEGIARLCSGEDGMVRSSPYTGLGDADAESLYFYTYEELSSTLDGPEMTVAKTLFNLSPDGQFTRPSTALQQQDDGPGLNVLRTVTQFKSKGEKATYRSIIEKLRKFRSKKAADFPLGLFAPLQLNARYASALVAAWRATGEDRYRDLARQTLEKIQSDLVNDSSILVGWSNGAALDHPARAGALASLMAAALDLAEITAEPQWLTFANSIANHIQENHLNDQTALVQEGPINSGLPLAPSTSVLTLSDGSTVANLKLQMHRLTTYGQAAGLEPLTSSIAAFAPRKRPNRSEVIPFLGHFTSASPRLFQRRRFLSSEANPSHTFFTQRQGQDFWDLTVAITPDSTETLLGERLSLGSVVEMTESGEIVVISDATDASHVAP